MSEKILERSRTPKVCLTIAGLDPSGGAGIITDIRTFSAFGCFPAAAVASLTFQNTTGVFGTVNQTAEAVRGQATPVFQDYEVSAVKTGMLPTREVIEEVLRLVEEFKVRHFVVDPVVRSTSGFDLIDDAALRSLKKLFPLSSVITPNIPEAERLANIKIETAKDFETAAKIIQESGARNVLIKGGHFFEKNNDSTERRARDYLFEDEKLTVFEDEFYETEATHGTGCTLAAAITANLALGKNLREAIQIAKNFVNEAIRTAPKLGHGHSPINVGLPKS